MITRNINDDNTLSYLFNNQKKSSDRANETADAAQAAADAAQADLDDFKDRFGRLVYPVGSIYLSVNDTSPASLFGGAWTRIQDTFLLAAGETYQPGDTGGEAQHTITVAEMPSHRHWISAGTYDDGNMSTTGKSNTQDNGLAADAGAYSENDTCKTYGRYSAWGGGENGANGKGTGSNPHTNVAHNNMPPYLAVYVWERTA